MNDAVPPAGAVVTLQQRLDDARKRHGVIGASLAVLRGGVVETAASGLLNLDTGIEVRAESPFQIGSIGKLFTATLAMQLVDERRLDLDVPIRRYLPDFAISDATVASQVTMRHLLCHNSGMEGDFFPQDDSAGPSTDNYVRKMALLPQLHELGAYMSYCNSGFVLAGRVVEVIAGRPWPQLVMEKICAPLGMRHAFADPREALRYRCAIGHAPDPRDASRLAISAMTYLPLSMAAAGAVLSMTASDLLHFVSAHLRGGTSETGLRILSEDSARLMRRPNLEISPHNRGRFNRMGIGWLLIESERHTLAGHDGACAGQFAYMLSAQDCGFAFALLTNSPSAGLADELRTSLLQSMGIRLVEPAVVPPSGWSPQRYVGVYENLAARLILSERAGGLTLEVQSRFPGSASVQQGDLIPHSADCFDIRSADPALQGKLTFVGDMDGRARFVRTGVRMARRVA